jgi:hypothetical protein
MYNTSDKSRRAMGSAKQYLRNQHGHDGLQVRLSLEHQDD